METEISFEDIQFKEEANKKRVKAVFLKNYYWYFSEEELKEIAPYRVEGGKLYFSEREKRVHNKFNQLLVSGFTNLRHIIGDKECLYVHQNSGIPLIGSNEFGVVDRGSNIIEIKPLTGCNLACTFCSVSEGVNNGKRDIIVEEEYLIQEFSKLAQLKKHPVEANIGPQGEPLLYPKFVTLVSDLKKNGASVVSVNTNGTLINKQLIDELAFAGLDRINLSLHTLNQEKSNDIMGGIQDGKRLLEMIDYCAGKIDILLAPVLIPGINDEDIDDIIILSKKISSQNKHWPSIGIQNFLTYPGGRNPGVKERTWEEFYTLLKEKEEQLFADLMLKGNLDIFNIHEEATLAKPFMKGDTIKVELLARGRTNNEWLAVAGERVITLRNCEDGKIGLIKKIRLARDKHNIFTANC